MFYWWYDYGWMTIWWCNKIVHHLTMEDVLMIVSHDNNITWWYFPSIFLMRSDRTTWPDFWPWWYWWWNLWMKNHWTFLLLECMNVGSLAMMEFMMKFLQHLTTRWSRTTSPAPSPWWRTSWSALRRESRLPRSGWVTLNIWKHICQYLAISGKYPTQRIGLFVA